MKQLLLTIGISLSILGMSAMFFVMGAKHFRNNHKKCEPCPDCDGGNARHAGQCDCDKRTEQPVAASKSKVRARRRAEYSRGRRPVKVKAASLEDKLQEAFTKTGCPNKLGPKMIDRLSKESAFGVGTMYDVCAQASAGVGTARDLCGIPTRECRMASVDRTFDEIKNTYNYEKQNSKTIFRPNYGTFQSLEEAQDHCNRTLACKGVVFDDATREFHARGGDEASSEHDIAWIRRH